MTEKLGKNVPQAEGTGGPSTEATSRMASFKEMLEIPVGAGLFQVMEILADTQEPVHDLPEPPRWREKVNRGIGVWWVRQEGSTISTCEGPCTVKTSVQVFNAAGKSFCEPLRTVVVREVAGGASAGGAVTGSGFGGGVTVPNYFYRVVKYEIGTRYQYEFHVKVKITIKSCPGAYPQVTREILSGGWVLVGTVPHAICSREILADGIDSPDDAKRIADTNAPPGSGIGRSDSNAGLKDQP